MEETIFYNDSPDDSKDSSLGNYYFTNPSFQMDHGNLEEKIRHLESQLEEYKEILRMKEQEINAFIENNDILENEHDLVCSQLSEAERKIDELQKNHVENLSLIAHLREEIEILTQNISLEKRKISFSQESDPKVSFYFCFYFEIF